MEEQRFGIKDNVVYQDKQSAILLERNGHASSGRRSWPINICYFLTDRIKQGELRVEYFSTREMLADFFTKPLQARKPFKMPL
jgi:hypothetical protein